LRETFMSKFVSSLVVALLAAMTVQAQWQKQTVNTTADLRGLSVVNENVVWACGAKGTFVRSVDGGKTWQVGTVPGAESLDFRDIEAFDAYTAYILSIGAGELSRIYKTTDGGATWTMQFKNTNAKAFFDALAFWDESHGIAISDPVDEKFLFIMTNDGGKSWEPLVPQRIRPAFPGESLFAASGTCIITQGKTNVWFVTGGTAGRVFSSIDRGQTWSTSATTIVSGVESAGIFSIAFYDANNGILVGGDYQKPNETKYSVAMSSDAGFRWNITPTTPPSGYRSCVVYVPGTKGKTLVAVGSSGSDISRDGGATWKEIDKENYNSVDFFNSKTGWAIGPKGMIARFNGDL
jgi:photosystem II stability/assembly factor-like uncharacterized protein